MDSQLRVRNHGFATIGSQPWIRYFRPEIKKIEKQSTRRLDGRNSAINEDSEERSQEWIRNKEIRNIKKQSTKRLDDRNSAINEDMKSSIDAYFEDLNGSDYKQRIEMRFALALAAICLAVSYAEPAISQARTAATTTSTKPGRFLSLPVPAKCASLLA
uniref:Uncharacterized protein n=1 Tax=Glossina brevipalpis TaxID=37001 RepID=A0A1A9WAL2_9MUSC